MLTPFEFIEKTVRYDYRSILSYHLYEAYKVQIQNSTEKRTKNNEVETVGERLNTYFNHDDIMIQRSVDLILMSVSYEHIKTLTDSFIDNVLIELVHSKANEPSDEEHEEYMFVPYVIDTVFDLMTNFVAEQLAKTYESYLNSLSTQLMLEAKEVAEYALEVFPLLGYNEDTEPKNDC